MIFENLRAEAYEAICQHRGIDLRPAHFSLGNFEITLELRRNPQFVVIDGRSYAVVDGQLAAQVCLMSNGKHFVAFANIPGEPPFWMKSFQAA